MKPAVSSATLSRLFRVVSPSARVLLLAAVQASVAVALWLVFVQGAQAPLAEPHVPWWMLLPAFALAELWVFDIRVRRESQSVSLSEIPLVLGLFYAAPVELLAARLVGSLLVLVLARRHTPLKAAYNISVMALEVTVLLVVFHAFLNGGVLGAGGPLAPTGWVAMYLAVMTASLMVAASISLVLMVFEGPPKLSDLRSMISLGPAMSLLVATVALTGVYALDASAWSAMPLLVSLGVLLVSYRIYARLSDRHLDLERLYRFTQAVTSTPEMDDVLRNVLKEARAMLRAETVSVLFAAGERSHLRVTLSPADRLERVDAIVEPSDWVWARAMAGSPVLLPRGLAHDAGATTWLEGQRLREAVAVPLHGDVGVIGALLVGDRSPSVHPYDRGDVELLVTVANHASSALQNGQLVDRLRHEALHDGLTGLPNRKLLQRTLAQCFADDGSAAGAHHQVGLLVLDLDGFKQINDSMGHESGDVVLREFADRMRDVLPDDVLVSRLGGDEFAILATRGIGERGLRRIGELILESLSAPMTIHGKDVRVGASIGAALAPGNGTNQNNLLKRADVAMYAAKSAGGGLRIYDSSLHMSAPERLISGAA